LHGPHHEPQTLTIAGPRSASKVIPALPSKHSSSVPLTVESTVKEEQSTSSPFDVAEGVVVQPLTNKRTTKRIDKRFI
jgi:hypothetical protein